jgi:signal transduction histidine kinase
MDSTAPPQSPLKPVVAVRAGWFAPANIMIAAVLVAFAMAAAVIAMATQQSWLGLKLAYDAKAGGAVVEQSTGPAAAVPQGAVLTSMDGMTFQAMDFIIEPDGSLGRFANYPVFLDRQAALSNIQRSPSVTFTDTLGRAWRVEPARSRPPGDLPPDFWVQLVVGLFAWLISASIWALRPWDTSARYLLLSGWSTLMFAPFAAVYSTRELALPRTLFHWINDLNFLGGSLFAASFAALLLYYPRKLAPRWVGLSIVALFLVWFVAQQFGAFDSMTFARRALVLTAVLATFVLAFVHWWLTRKDPVARAALQWFLLSWLAGAVIFAAMIFVPQFFGIDTSALQGYAFLLFLLVYVGLAFGIMRFALFELGEWWIRIVAWTGSVLVLVGLDLLFLLGLNLSSGLSLSLALLICGLVWLPLRGWLWSRFLGRPGLDERAQFETVIEVGFSVAGPPQADRWTSLLQKVFDPLHLQRGEEVTQTTIADDGLALLIPRVDGLAPLRLEYSRGGRRLFNRRDVARADDLVRMLRHVIQSRSAYEEGVAVERRRIASDIHDNVGGPLLSALHAESGERKDALIRETLADLRGIITDAAQPGAPLAEVLAQIRHETAGRLEPAGIALDWSSHEEPDGPSLPSALVHTLRSVLREAVSNVIKHAGATHLRVEARRQGADLVVEVSDDGRGFDIAAPREGQGLTNIRSRVSRQSGTAQWSSGAKGVGTTLIIRLPIKGA